MKTKLTLLLALLALCGSGWATTLNIASLSSTTGTFGSGNYTYTWTSKGTTPALTIQSLYNDMSTSGDSRIYATKSSNGAEKYTLSVPSGYVITGYSFTASFVEGSVELTITPEMGGAAQIVSSTNTTATVSVSNISSTSTYFNFTVPANTPAATPIVISNLVVTVENAAHGLSDGIYTITYTSGWGSHYMTASAGLGAYGKYSSGSDAGIYRVAYSSATGNYTIQEVGSGKYVGAKSSVLSAISASSSPYTSGNVNAIELASSSSNYTSRWTLQSVDGKYRLHPAGMTLTSIAVFSGTNAYFSMHETSTGYDHARAVFSKPTLAQLINNKIEFATIVSLGEGYAIEDIRTILINNNEPTNKDMIGWPTSDAWTTFQTTVNAFTTSSTYDDLDTALDVLWTNVKYPETGYYYIKSVGARDWGVSYITYSSAGLVTQTTSDMNSIIRLKKESSVYKLSVQGLNLQPFSTHDQQAQVTSDEGCEVALSVYSPGVLIIENSITGSPVYASYSKYLHEKSDKLVISWEHTEDASHWTIEKVEDFDVTLNSGGDGNYYATFCAPFSYTVSGATAYTLEKSGNWLVPTAINEAVPAGTPVVLKGTSGTATLTISGTSYAATPLTTTALTGTYTGTTITGDDYVLGKDGDNVGFYHWNRTDLAANRAYLQGAAGVKGFVLMFDDDDATALKSLTPALSEGEGAIYNIAGQRLSKMQKGVNIVNGKKVLF